MMYTSPTPLFQRLSVMAVIGVGALIIGATLLFIKLGHAPVTSFPTFGSNQYTGGSNDLLDHVLNRTLGFQKIFVINLKSRTDHRDSMSLAAAMTGIDLEFVDGVTEVSQKALPPGGKEVNLDKGALGNWRAHMNVARMIVEQNITSAIVLEDDVDWDVRIKSQLQDFARASRTLLQPLRSTPDQFADPSYPRPHSDQAPEDLGIPEKFLETSKPVSSPYGDIERWDLLWFGHCGCRFPRASDVNVPIGRAVLSNDETVPEKQHINMQFGDSELMDNYPEHTRVVSRAWENVCTVGYGISQPGARRFLHDMGIKRMTGPTDIMFREVCSGSETQAARNCLSVQPQLFQHHRPVGEKASESDISDHSGDGYNDVAFTRNVRVSTKVNLAKLIDGSTDLFDQFRDGEEADTNLGWRR